ncbi:MAG: asparagine synthase-related protein [Armatimonadota bacterium]|jgi:asparagine synthase (glutamine-hydrolysing)
MSSLAGWQGAVRDGGDILQRMAEAMSGPRPEIAQRITDGFSATTTQPAVRALERIASSHDGHVTLVLAGYLLTDDCDARRFPARHCLDMYLDSGPAFAAKLSGSFAIVIHDAREPELHLITDRLVTRPLYYRTGTPFLFASQVKAILEFPGVSRTPNVYRLLEFLALYRVFSSGTHYDHIKAAPEASVTTWDGADVRVTRYWEPPFDTEKCWSLRENTERIYAALRRATARACAGAERPALMLSGGMDSRAVAMACATPPLCLTLHKHPGYEVRVARRVADALGCEHQLVQLPVTYPLERVTDGALLSDAMAAFHHAQPLYMADLLAERGTDALLSGKYLEPVLSDRVLARRRWNVLGRRWRLPILVPEQHFDLAQRALRRQSMDRTPGVRQLVKQEHLDQLEAQAHQRVLDWTGPLPEGASSLHEFVAFSHYSGRASCKCHPNVLAMERLVPSPIVTYDSELIDLFFTVPTEHRVFHRLQVCLFTAVDRRCRWIPYSNRGVPLLSSPLIEFLASAVSKTASRALCAGLRRVAPARAEILDRRPWPRVATAMRDCPEWHTYLRDRVASSRLVDMDLLHGDVLRRLVERQIAGTANNWGLLGNWITLEEWLSHYG